MNINFTKIRYKNFLSSGDEFTEVFLNKTPLTLIVGKNGAGKSTILDALCFCLFKKPFRKINLGLLVNSITKKNCVVEVEFLIGDDNYLVSRGIKPNKFEIFKNGTLLNHTNTDDYQTYLEQNILHINHKAFCQVVVLGSASYIPFLELSTPDRRKIIENLLDLEVFSTMNIILKKRVQDNEKEIREVSNKKILVNDRISQMIEYQNKRAIENQEKISTFETMLQGYRDLIKEKRQYIKERVSDESMRLFKERHLTIEEEFSKAREEQTTIRHILIQNKKDINFYTNNCNCDVCKQVIDEKFKQEIISTMNEIVKKKEYELICIEDKIKNHSQKLADIMIMIDNARKNNEGQDRLEFEINSIIKQGLETKALVDKLKSEIINDQTEELKNLNLELDELNKEYDCLSKKSSVMEVGLKLLKDDGIKANVILQYVDVINELINSFLLEMDFICQFNLDENFNEIIRSRYRDQFVYGSFSEGEKMRIDISLLLTWKEIARRRNSLNANILFFDEVLDASLDTEGAEQFVNIIKKVLPNNNVFIISHNEKNKNIIEDVIEFKKSSKGFSRVEQT